MEIRTVKLTDLRPYENNPRKNAQAVEYVAASIEDVGYISPIIVDEDMVILAGHTRYQALESMGVDEVEVGIVTDLTEEQKKKYRLLDNKTNEFAQWDFDVLRSESEGLNFNFDFKLGDLFTKAENLEETENKAKEKAPMNRICTCPRCGKEWEE